MRLMKRVTLWIVGAGVTGVVLMLALRAQEPQTVKTDVAQEEKPEKIAFTFSEDEQMQQFALLWQQRQLISTRMAVLQNYWNLEQGNLTDVNKQLLEKFNLDVNKNYALDADRKVLVEREAVPPSAPLDQAPAQDQQPPATP